MEQGRNLIRQLVANKDDLEMMSDISLAALDILQRRHFRWRSRDGDGMSASGRSWAAFGDGAWAVTTGKVIGEVIQTPPRKYWGELQPPGGHSNDFPAQIGRLIRKAHYWVDVTSLAPPDGEFLEQVREAIKAVAERPVIFRFLFGNIIAMPVDTNKVLRSLTEGLPPESKIQIWVGAFRKNLSWNHSKIIAVDGRYLIQGGHNLWTNHYLHHNPVHDLSQELEGRVTIHAHRYANEMWRCIDILRKGNACFNCMKDVFWCVPAFVRLGIAHYPDQPNMKLPYFKVTGAMFALNAVADLGASESQTVLMIALGRYGGTTPHKTKFGGGFSLKKKAWIMARNPADSALPAMMGAAKREVLLSLQDLGPIALPGTKSALPGCPWPSDYLNILGRLLVDKVNVYLVLSNPHAIPGSCGMLEANYGNGWTDADVGVQIVREGVWKHDSTYHDKKLQDLLETHLHIALIKRQVGEHEYEKGKPIGNHAKFFMVDEACYYLGSQNLYVADLAEFGVIIDSERECQKIKEEYWNPLWNCSAWNRCKTEDILKALKEPVPPLAPVTSRRKWNNASFSGGLPDSSFIDDTARQEEESAPMSFSKKSFIKPSSKNLRQPGAVS